MKIYQRFDEQWVFVRPELERLVPSDWREINPDPTIAHTIELDSCNAIITSDSVELEHDRKGLNPTLSLEEMQRVTRCMEMLAEANSND